VGIEGGDCVLIREGACIDIALHAEEGQVRSHLAHRNARVDDGHACIVLHGAAGAYGLRLEYFLQVT
jgi:hypothetical protein